MAIAQGSLRLVAGRPESVGMGSPVSDAFDALKTEVQKLAALTNQLSNTALSNQLTSTLDALNVYKAAADAAMAAPAPASPAQAMVPESVLKDAETLIYQLQAQLTKFGYTFSNTTPAGVPPANLATTTPTIAAPGTFTTGQVGAVGVAGALIGWLGHGMWEDYEHKRGRR